MSIPQEAEWLTRQQVAKMFQVSSITVKRWGEEGKLPVYHVGGSVRYKRSEVEDLPEPIAGAQPA
jgi:excisionase family DNA binding protein